MTDEGGQEGGSPIESEACEIVLVAEQILKEAFFEPLLLLSEIFKYLINSCLLTDSCCMLIFIVVH